MQAFHRLETVSDFAFEGDLKAGQAPPSKSVKVMKIGRFRGFDSSQAGRMGDKKCVLSENPPGKRQQKSRSIERRNLHGGASVLKTNTL